MSELDILGADALADLRELEAVAEAIFGRGDRRAGWLARKLVREGVEPGLSAIALARADLRGEAARATVTRDDVIGYVLVGGAPSLGGIVRGAGIGLRPGWRGRGHGPRLLHAARERARAAGYASLELLAEPDRLAWYTREGFAVVEEQLALIAHGSAAADREDLSATTGEAAALGAAPRWAWIPEHWSRTPAHERAYVERAGARLWLSREGRAWMVQRCELSGPTALLPALGWLRQRLGRSTPLLLYPIPANTRDADALLAAGFGIAQRSFVVRRDT